MTNPQKVSQVRYWKVAVRMMLSVKDFTVPEIDRLPECQASIQKSLAVNDYAKAMGRPSRTPGSYVVARLKDDWVKVIGKRDRAILYALTVMGRKALRERA